MIFGVLCFVVAAFGNVKGALSPIGEHVCMVDEKYVDVIQVEELKPVTVYKVEWCWRIPPRCTVQRQKFEPVLVTKEIPRVRIVPKCCKGYREVVAESKCVPVCSEPCLNGDCTAPDECSCESGFRGDRCEKPCESGTWGRGCLEKCDCRNNATCDGVHGQCNCTPGWKGIRCDSPCEPGYYGIYCENRCGCDGVLCNHVTGICEIITEAAPTTTETTMYETTTEIGDITSSTESSSETSTFADGNETESSTVEDLPSSTSDSLGVHLDEGSTEQPDNALVNETVEDNEIEHSEDFLGVERKKFNIFNLLENLSIICGIFVLIFVVTMSSVMVSHYRKIRKTGFEPSAKNASTNSQQFPLHRFYGGSILPFKTVLDNQICTTNMDLEVEQPKLMTFKPLQNDKPNAEYFMQNKESNNGRFYSFVESAPIHRIVQYEYDEPKSIASISTRCKSV